MTLAQVWLSENLSCSSHYPIDLALVKETQRDNMDASEKNERRTRVSNQPPPPTFLHTSTMVPGQGFKREAKVH